MYFDQISLLLLKLDLTKEIKRGRYSNNQLHLSVILMLLYWLAAAAAAGLE